MINILRLLLYTISKLVNMLFSLEELNKYKVTRMKAKD